MEGTGVLFLVIAGAVAAIIAILRFRKKPELTADDPTYNYAEGLNLLLSGQREAALRKFKATIKKDSNNIDAYLKIGDILRELGNFERAINVHKYLTVRRGLTAKQHHEILKSLALDYQAASDYDNALNVLTKVLETDKTVSWALEMKLTLYEAKQDWANAFETFKEIKHKNGKTQNNRLAIYRVQEGIMLLRDGKKKEAQARFKEAIKIAPEIPPGYIYLADFYKNEERKSDALSVLKQFVEKIPEQSHLAFERIKDLLYEGGVYGEIENLYKEIIASQPDNIMAHLALAENYEKRGDLKKAIKTCLYVLEKESENKSARGYLVRLYHKIEKNEQALEIAIGLIEESLSNKDDIKFDLSQFTSN